MFCYCEKIKDRVYLYVLPL